MGKPSPEHRATLNSASIPIIDFEFKSRFDFAGMLRLRRVVKERSIQLVYALSNRALSSAVIGLVGVPVKIVAYRGTVGHISWWDPSSWFTYLNPRVSKILCVSLAVERYLLEVGIPAKRLTTIYKGHDPEWYRFPSAPMRREDFGIPDDAFVIGCTAVMRSVKGIDDLITAVASLLDEIPKLHLLLVGSIKDPQIEAAVRAFPAPGRIHLTGFRSDATRLATLADATVMASKSREGFPKSVIEAMAQGVPAIVTAVGGMPELVGNGTAGILVKPCEPHSIAEAIVRLFRDQKLRSELGQSGAQRIATVFNISETIDKTHTLFRELLEVK
jgi:glycosyltransferase involved in cell wall biosynthesis